MGKFVNRKNTYSFIFKISDKWNNTKRPEDIFDLRILSFNILAQDLLETYPYLYINHDRKTLAWEKRKPLIIEEILESQAHVSKKNNYHLKKYCCLKGTLLCR